jgi:hypothetical protein
MCVVQKNKQVDDALKVSNSFSLLDMRACAASGRRGGLARVSFAQRASFSCTATRSDFLYRTSLAPNVQ